MKQLGFFDRSDDLKRLSETGDPLEAMARVIDFEAFRPTLEAALAYSHGAKGGRPAYDAVAMFKVLQVDPPARLLLAEIHRSLVVRTYSPTRGPKTPEIRKNLARHDCRNPRSTSGNIDHLSIFIPTKL